MKKIALGLEKGQVVRFLVGFVQFSSRRWRWGLCFLLPGEEHHRCSHIVISITCIMFIIIVIFAIVIVIVNSVQVDGCILWFFSGKSGWPALSYQILSFKFILIFPCLTFKVGDWLSLLKFVHFTFTCCQLLSWMCCRSGLLAFPQSGSPTHLLLTFMAVGEPD